uniref:Uncharacterized protein n=1 Tax=Candidatus Kentrum sp. LPFa TaxID=2126335 RepID=A0A450X932_9GAMM|nr:MAG: hypothetical protein BECKLPF1236A_GA0070988_1002812 [Candidatus Kentron sp. LPFa]VFK25700.1 MAG: hypothetical protein BECKLPF1236C_GA0070990_1002413 [Candidatus Kentron sp. LPFa]
MLRKRKVGKIKAKAMKKAVKGFGRWYWKNGKDDIAYIDELRKKILADGRNPSKYGM